MFVQMPKLRPIEWVLYHNGQEVFRATTEQAVWTYLMRLLGRKESVLQAVQVGGYRVEPIRG